MNTKKWWNNSSLLEKGIAFVSIISAIMLIAIGLAYLFYPSFNIEKWGNFGDYFGSITGLLAFSGVLYTLLLSENRTDKLEDESIRREERDLFFKLLELHQKKLDSVYFDVIDKSNGIQAFKDFGGLYNNLLSHYITSFRIVIDSNEGCSLVEDNYSDYNIRQQLSALKCQMKKSFNITSNTSKDDAIIRSVQHHIYGYNCYLKNRIKPVSYQNIQGSFKPELDLDNLYKAIVSIGNYMDEKYNHIFRHYYRNMYYLLKTCSDFKKSDKEYYFKLYRAQLSKPEILLCLFNAVTEKSSTKLAELLRDNYILDDFTFKDLFTNQEGNTWEGDESITVKQILDLYLEEHKEQV